MLTSLQVYLSWDLFSPRQYVAEQELAFNLSFIAPKAGKYYLLGALYDTNLNYIAGTLCGVLLHEGSDYAVNSLEHASLWELEVDGQKDLPCKFTLNRTDVVLGLFLMRMVGDSPSLEYDEQVASLATMLSSPAPPVPPVTGESLLQLALFVAFSGIMVHEVLKEE